MYKACSHAADRQVKKNGFGRRESGTAKKRGIDLAEALL